MYLFMNSVLLFASKQEIAHQDTQASAHKPIDFWMKRHFEEKRTKTSETGIESSVIFWMPALFMGLSPVMVM